MKIPFLSRFSGKAILDIEISEDTDYAARIRVALELAVKTKASLRGADLGGASLYGADLRGADLGGADLGGASLYGADLRGADLYGASLRGADLGGADLRGADLGGASLYGADLRGADLGGADLGGADLGERFGKLVGCRPFLQVGPIGSRGDTMLAFNCERGVFVRAGCFFDTLNLFEVAVAETHGDSEHGRAYSAAVELVKAMWPQAVGE